MSTSRCIVYIHPQITFTTSQPARRKPMQSLVTKQELTLEITSSSQLAHLAPCPLCWAQPRELCKFDDRKTPAKYIPEYHWARLERYERHMPGVARSMYMHEISQLGILDLMSIFFRRLEFEQKNLQHYHISARTTREELITVLLPTGRRDWLASLEPFDSGAAVITGR